MGSINFTAECMFGSLSDLVGVKSGLALSKPRIVKIFTDDGRFSEYADAPEDAWVRVLSVAYEEMCELLLYAAGRLEQLDNLPPMPSLRRKYGQKPETLKAIDGICDLYLAFMNGLDLDSMPRGSTIDPSDFMRQAARQYGKLGLDMAYDFVHAQVVQQEIKSCHFPEIHRGIDIIHLDDLFESEGLPEHKGTFFDQRYIDFLHRNFDQIDQINWRKFEGLTAEYFSRHGFAVDLGPGRNDDGVDIRVWPSREAVDQPPAIIIQCKRQKAAVSKVIVKSLYTDVVHANATSGLIVTTSRLSPGAKSVCEARRYPIGSADRARIRQWVGEMRKTGMGVVT